MQLQKKLHLNLLKINVSRNGNARIGQNVQSIKSNIVESSKSPTVPDIILAQNTEHGVTLIIHNLGKNYRFGIYSQE